METNLKKTCLHSRHEELGAKMAPFAGFDMPIEYAGAGLDAEHKAVRTSVGVFDVSHMGEVLVTGPEAREFVGRIFTNDLDAVGPGTVLYGMMTRPSGVTVDDLLVYKIKNDGYLLVINASNIEKDVEWIMSCADNYKVTVANLSDVCGELAVQGPDSAKILVKLLGLPVDELTFYTFRFFDTPKGQVLVSRTGYTGEDGFEVYASPEYIVELWDALMKAGVQPCGLGCRDTLRFEAGLPLYGHELSEDITPVEAALSMFVKTDKAGGFIGSDSLKHQKADGTKRKVVGLEIDSPATARAGFEVLDTDGNIVGTITTGYRSLTLGRNLAMAIVDAGFAALGTPLQVKIRRKTAPAVVVKKRFYTPNYKR